MNNIIKENWEIIEEKVIKPMYEDGSFPLTVADEIIKALEKQTPKKPIKDRKQEIRYTSSYSCSSCGGGFTGTGIADYCYHCGQKLDWSVEDE